MTPPASSGRRREAGQATVELVALLPVALIVALAIFCALAAGRARELAGHAAGAGAIALLRDRDPERAAREALPGHAAREASVSVRGGTVSVSVTPRLPLRRVADLLTATARADAGPVPAS